MTDELHRALEQVGDSDVGAISGSHEVGEAHLEMASNGF